jgi:hypothetical protein
VRAPSPLRLAVQEEAAVDSAPVACWLEARGTACAVTPPALPAPRSGVGPSVPVAPPATTYDDAHLWANPTARIPTQLDEARWCWHILSYIFISQLNMRKGHIVNTNLE